MRGEGGRERSLVGMKEGGGGGGGPTEGKNFYYHTCAHFKHFRDFM